MNGSMRIALHGTGGATRSPESRCRHVDYGRIHLFFRVNAVYCLGDVAPRSVSSGENPCSASEME
ncbi:MAG: hypothetical protein V4793_00965, partial [Paraburkholderia tropica]